MLELLSKPQCGFRKGYSTLLDMLHSRIINNKINRLWVLMSIIRAKILKQDKSVTIHTRNLQILATEIFKVY